MRHGNHGVDQVVPASELPLVTVESAELCVQLVDPTRTKTGGTGTCNHRKIWWGGAKPLFAILGIECDIHVIANVIRSKEQITSDFLLGQADVSQLVVHHRACAVTVEAVVDELLGTVLQSGLSVIQFGGFFVGVLFVKDKDRKAN